MREFEGHHWLEPFPPGHGRGARRALRVDFVGHTDW